MIYEELEQYEEEEYGEPSYSTSSRFSRDDVDFLLQYYNEVICHKYTSVIGQMFSGKNSKESFQYFMEYYDLRKEIREVLYL